MNISKLITNEEEVSDFERTNHQSYNNRRTNNKTHNDSSILFQPDHQFQLHNKQQRNILTSFEHGSSDCKINNFNDDDNDRKLNKGVHNYNDNINNDDLCNIFFKQPSTNYVYAT